MTNTGYIYLSLEELRNTPLVHLISGIDEDTLAFDADVATATAITGYTEWVSQGGHVLTIGWDWQMLGEDNAVQLRRIGRPSSNIMLQSESRVELGHDTTGRLLEHFIDGMNWQTETHRYIKVRYST